MSGLDLALAECPYCGCVPHDGGEACDPRKVLERAAEICDRISLRKPDNKHADKPRAAYRAGATKCAWELRQLAKRP